MDLWLKGLFIGSSNCEECLKIIESMLDGESTPEQELFLIEHLEKCEPCFDHYDLESSVRKMIKERIKNKPLPAGLIEAVKSNVRRIA